MRLKTFPLNDPMSTIEFSFSDKEQEDIRKAKNPVSKALSIVSKRVQKETGDKSNLKPVPGTCLTGI